jgi:hypothetical protein
MKTMSRLTIGMGCIAAAMLVMPVAGAITVVEDPHSGASPPNELNFYDIYNLHYATGVAAGGHTFTDSDGVGGTAAAPVELGDLQWASETGTFSVGTPTVFTFEAIFAGDSNRMGYYTTDAGSVPNGTETLLFGGAWMSGQDAHTHPLVADVLVGGATHLGFFLENDMDGDTNTVENTWYSVASSNTDTLDHMVMYFGLNNDGSTNFNEVMIGWEDRSLGDVDYNDYVVVMNVTGDFGPSDPIPEPATIALMVLGLSGVALRKRFSA